MERGKAKNKVVLVLAAAAALGLVVKISGVSADSFIQSNTEGQCEAANCTGDTTEGSKYCKYHTCPVDGCTEQVSPGSRCSEHQKEYDEFIDELLRERSSIRAREANQHAKETETTAKKSKKNNHSSSSDANRYSDSYDDGYEDVYDDEDYDEERYENDPDYANGVDDARDDMGW